VANPVRCIVAGDSFVEGTTADGVPGDVMGLSGLVNHMGWHLGLDDVWSSGSGGTGWLRATGNRIALNDRFQRDVIDRAPDLAVIAMGVNDGEQDPGLLRTVVTTWCANFRHALPTSPLIIVAPWSPQGAGPLDIRTAIIAGAQAENSGKTFVVDPGMPGAEWQWPAPGHQGMPTGVGNGDWAVDAGGTHPSIAGHAYLGARLANAIKQQLMA
jgi:lysophospholipase L1-like esterase